LGAEGIRISMLATPSTEIVPIKHLRYIYNEVLQ
jgi:hypothetical protein